MVVLYVSVILLLVSCAFYAGMKTSDRYHREAEERERYALQRQYARLVTGSDADDSCQPYIAYAPKQPQQPIPPEFMDCLRSNKRATIQVTQ